MKKFKLKKDRKCLDCNISIGELYFTCKRCKSCAKKRYYAQTRYNIKLQKLKMETTLRRAKKRENRKCVDCNISIAELYCNCTRCKRCSKEIKKIHEKKYYDKGKQSLTDNYIKSLIASSNIRFHDISDDFVKVKRKYEQIRRELDKIKERK